MAMAAATSIAFSPKRFRHACHFSRAIRCASHATSIRTPHSGYHYDGTGRRFMEGWYFKVSLPKEKQSFAWMYSIEDPGCSGGFLTGPRFPGVGAQVLGADDEYLFQYDKDINLFWASSDELALGTTFRPKQGALAPRTMLPPEEFRSLVEDGYQADTFLHQGVLRDNGRTSYLKTVASVEWEYTTVPVYGWGSSGSEQKATAGWLAAFPVFEPHWQICMAGGLSTGWIKWGDKKFEFENAPSYVEKNWGGTFPEKWFWVQCNVFHENADVALTAGGGKRGLPLIPGNYEEVAMIGVHHAGKFYEFVPWLGNVNWEIAPWGSWKMEGYNNDFEVELQATTEDPGTVLRAPTNDQGLAPFCKDTFAGNLSLKIWQRSPSGLRGKVVLDVASDMAALEVGGGPWYSSWKKTSTMQQPLKTLLNLQPDLQTIFSAVPLLKPPGL